MLMNDANAAGPDGGLPLAAAADLQDHLLIASHDLERLQTLLSDACNALMASFHGATEQLQGMTPGADTQAAMDNAQRHLFAAVTALQFQDMASQLIAHTTRRLRNCCDRLAAEAMGDDEEGAAIVEEAPLRPNPVTQDEMDAGSIELF
ncbi:MAG: hypothetical protein AB1430_24230 [Pseudomonadota bacterium]